jgi:hypothetical protein
VLLRDWDPIGIADVPQAQDEYDGYVGQVYRLLSSRASDEDLVSHLATIELQTMGLPSVDRTHLQDVVRRLREVDLQDAGLPVPDDAAVIAALDDAPYALSLAEVVARLGGDPEILRASLERLAVEGYVKMTADRATRAYYTRSIRVK